MGIFAVIFGKAYYEGILKLKDLEQFILPPRLPVIVKSDCPFLEFTEKMFKIQEICQFPKM